MATKKRVVKRRKKHTHYGPAKKHRRRVNGVNPAVLSGTRRKRKHKVSGITGNDLMDFAIDAFVPDSVDPKIKSIGKAVIGTGGAYYAIKNKNMFVLGMSAITAGGGIKETAENMGILKGLENIMSGLGMTVKPKDQMLIEMNGIDRKMFINGRDGLNQNVMGNNNPSVIGML